MIDRNAGEDSEDLIAWLCDAHAMELAVAEVLEEHIRDTDDLPLHQERLHRHLAETRGHAGRLRECLEGMGVTVRDREALLGDVFGRSRFVALGMADDEIVRCLACECAAEHFEIATYRAILTAARALDFGEVGSLCEQILQEEEEMARWIESQIPVATLTYLRQKRANSIQTSKQSEEEKYA
jgi:ferritin-like metal-binding protein YciE